MPRRGYSIYRKKGQGPFYVAWTNGTGRRHAKVASGSRQVAQEIGRSKAQEADRVRGGVVSPTESKARQAGREPVERHTAAWRKHLLECNRTAKYAAMQASRVDRLLASIGVESLDELTAERIQSGLARIAEDHSPNTANHYRQVVGMFCRWCVRTHRLIGTPMPAVDKLTEHGPTFRRYAFDDPAQLEALYAATLSRATKCPVSGIDRAMYYRLMAYTGFRLSEALSLTPESFELSGPEPTITTEAAYSKRRRRDTQLITDDFADLLRPWLASKPAGKPVFGFAEWSNFSRIFRRDCAAAGIVAPKSVRLGIHSLRRFYITNVVRAGGLAVGQELARHSTPTLTKSYTDLNVRDYRKGLAGLPAAVRQEGKKKIG